MPAQKRFQTDYPGVHYIIGKAVATGKPEKIYYIDYRKDGQRSQEKAGRQFQDDMTPARAARIRAARIEGRELSNAQKREAEQAAKEADKGKWTIGRLADSYFVNRPDNKSRSVDAFRYEKFLKAAFEKKEPREISPLDVDRLRVNLLKTKSPQTVKHVLNLFTWIVNYGVKNHLSPGLTFHIKKPTVYNQTTEDLTPEQLKSLLEAIDADSNLQVGNMMRLILNTGMRRGECFKLKWSDIDFDRGFISLQDPKGGPDQRIPLNESARNLLLHHPRANSEYVFPAKMASSGKVHNRRLIRSKSGPDFPKTSDHFMV